MYCNDIDMQKLYDRYDIPKLYMEWLKGKSLRKLGSEIGVSRTTLQTWFRRQYGHGATSRNSTSMARTILEDYSAVDGIETVALDALKVEGNFYSSHSLDMLSEYQCLHDPRLMDILATEEDSLEYDEPLILPYFYLFVKALAHILNPFTMDRGDETDKTSYQGRKGTTALRAA